jgi:hypothetical protein
MTLVAVLFADEFPLVITDSLLSRVTEEGTGALSPLLDEVDLRAGPDGFKPVGLTRKFWLLPDKSLCFYAGTIGSAEVFFGRLSDELARGVPLTRELMLETREAVLQKLKSFSCIRLSPPKGLGEEGKSDLDASHTCDVIGNVVQADVPGYGYVLAIGTGAEPFVKLLRGFPAPPDGGETDKVLAALNAAARATLSYQEKERGLAEASSGGYFEVLMPWMFEKSFQWLMRGAAHVFLDITDAGPHLRRVVVAQQLEDRSVLLAGTDNDAYVHPDRIDFDPSQMYNVTIYGDRTKQAEAQRPAQIPIAHIAAVTVYCERMLPCGHLARTHIALYAGDAAVGSLLPIDDDVDRAPELPPRLRLEFFQQSLFRIEARLLAAECPVCPRHRLAVK